MTTNPFHGHSSLNSRGHGVDLARHPEVPKTLILLSDGIFGINSGIFHLTLFQTGLDLFLLSFLVLFGLFGQSVELLGAKLELEEVLCVSGERVCGRSEFLVSGKDLPSIWELDSLPSLSIISFSAGSGHK